MTGAVVEQGLNMTPLFALAFCIALFFIFIQKKPQKTMQVCGSLVALVFAIGLVTWILDFIASHAFVFFLLGAGLVSLWFSRRPVLRRNKTNTIRRMTRTTPSTKVLGNFADWNHPDSDGCSCGVFR